MVSLLAQSENHTVKITVLYSHLNEQLANHGDRFKTLPMTALL